MFCAEFDRRLQRRLDRRQPPESDRRLVRHARCCPTCRQMLTMQTLIAEQLTTVRQPLPPARLTARILARFEPGRPTRRSLAGRFLGWRPAGAALAASLVLGAWSLAMRGPASPSSKASPSAQAEPAMPEGPRQPASSASVAFALPPVADNTANAGNTATANADAAARQRFQLLAAETGQGLAAVVLRLPGVGAESAAASGSTSTASETGETPWVEDVTSRLKPIAASLSDALGPWLEFVPPDERSRRS